MGYIGNNLQAAFSTYKTIDDISGSFNGVTTSFALTVGGVAPVPAPLASNQCLISVGGVVQRPDDTGAEGFRLSGGNIVFSSAPNTGEDFFGVILAGADYVNVGVNFPSGSVSTPSITFDSDLDTGLYNPGANQLGFTTAGTNRLTIDASGNINLDSNTLYVDAVNNRVGIGTTSPGDKLTVSDGIIRLSSTTSTSNIITFYDTTGLRHVIGSDATAGTNEFGLRTEGQIIFGAGSGRGEAARIDASRRLLVGTSSVQTIDGIQTSIQLQGTTGATSSISAIRHSYDAGGGFIELGKSRATATGGVTVVSNNDTLGTIVFCGADGTDLDSRAAIIRCEVDGTPGANDMPGRLSFSTTADGASTPTERMRINSSGGLKASSVSFVDAVNPKTHQLFNRNNASGDVCLYLGLDTNAINTSSNMLVCTHIGIADVLFIRGNGNVLNTNNSYTGISDIKLKENVVDASSQWHDIKSLQVRNYNFKEETRLSTHRQIGLIAQEVESVCPHLVDESPDRDAKGNDLGTVTKSVNYSVLYMKAVKALQEAMERIEILEAEVATLKAQ